MWFEALSANKEEDAEEEEKETPKAKTKSRAKATAAKSKAKKPEVEKTSTKKPPKRKQLLSLGRRKGGRKAMTLRRRARRSAQRLSYTACRMHVQVSQRAKEGFKPWCL